MIRRLAVLFAVFSIFSALPVLNAAPVTVRHPEGSSLGFLLLQTLDGKTVATGEMTVEEHGKDWQGRLVFHFNDGSVDDDTTIFTQHGTFHVISDHRIQKGPFFPVQMDTLIEDNGTVISKTIGRDGKEKVSQDHMDIPPDLANGMMGAFLDNLDPSAETAEVSMFLGSGKPTHATMQIHKDGVDEFRVGGLVRHARRYRIHIDLGGAKALLAPMVGKQPKDVYIWISEGVSPTVVREEGQTFEDGPVLRMVLTSPRVEVAGGAVK